MSDQESYPALRTVVLDAVDVRELAEFYRRLLGLHYRPGDEPPAAGEPDTHDWLVLRGGAFPLAFQETGELAESTWPAADVLQQLHLDLAVPDTGALAHQHERALALGARVLLDRTDDPDEPLWVYADPAGHPFCIFVGTPTT